MQTHGRPTSPNGVLIERASACSVDAEHPPNVGNLERAASVVVGAGALLVGVGKGRLPGLALAGIGAALIYRGVTGYCHGYDALGIDTSEPRGQSVIPARQGVKFEKSFRVAEAPEKLYAFWRDVENLPRIMRHLESVTAYDRDRSRWRARGPLNVPAEWDAVITQDRENELIAWKSEEGGQVDTAGSVRFEGMGTDLGTIVTVSMKYNPPGGKLAASVAKLFGGGLDAEIEEDLKRFKRYMETGETSAAIDS